jgi:hypothetical protein
MTNLTVEDYKKILRFYKKSIPKSKRLLKNNSEKILASKLCRCIKKLDKSLKKESRTIGICTKTVINNKGYRRGKFSCKNKEKIILSKNRTNKTKRRNKK